jgi:hypothetical protein
VDAGALAAILTAKLDWLTRSVANLAELCKPIRGPRGDLIIEPTPRERVFELTFTVDVPTTIPRVSLTFRGPSKLAQKCRRAAPRKSVPGDRAIPDEHAQTTLIGARTAVAW